MIGATVQGGRRRRTAIVGAWCCICVAGFVLMPITRASGGVTESKNLAEDGVALVGSAIKRDGSTPGAFYYALAVNGVTTNGTVGASDEGRIAFRLDEDDEGVFVLHSSCDCVIEVRVLRSGEVVDSATATGPHTVARVRFGSSFAGSSAE